ARAGVTGLSVRAVDVVADLDAGSAEPADPHLNVQRIPPVRHGRQVLDLLPRHECACGSATRHGVLTEDGEGAVLGSLLAPEGAEPRLLEDLQHRHVVDVAEGILIAPPPMNGNVHAHASIVARGVRIRKSPRPYEQLADLAIERLADRDEGREADRLRAVVL